MATRNYSSTATSTTITDAGGISAAATSLTVATSAGYPTAPFLIGLERGTTNEEVCLVTAVATNTFTVTRGYDGTTAKTHAQGSKVEHTSAAIEFAEANAHINNTSLDHHTQYVHNTVARTITAGHTFTGTPLFQPAAATSVAAIIKGAASQTADLQQWQDSGGTSVVRVTAAGSLVVSGDEIRANQTAFITGGVTTQHLLRIQALASHTGDLTRWQNSTGTVLASVNASGRLDLFGNVSAATEVVLRLGGEGNHYTVARNWTDGNLVITPTQAGYGGYRFNLLGSTFAIRGQTTQTVDLQQWQNSAGTVLSSVASDGRLGIIAVPNAAHPLYVGAINGRAARFDGGVGIGADAPTSASVFVVAGAATTVPAVVRGAASQSANLQQWQNSAGTILARVTSAGILQRDTTPAIYDDDARLSTTAATGSFLPYDGFINNNNPFGSRRFYIPRIDNYLASAASRFTVTGTGFGSSAWASLFDQNYDGGINIAAGATGVLTIDLAAKGEVSSLTYPEGFLYLSFYYTSTPASVSARVLANGVWVACGTPVNIATGSSAIWKVSVPANNYVTQIEITVVAPAGAAASLTQVEYVRSRPGADSGSAITKYGDNRLYGTLGFYDSANALKASVSVTGQVSGVLSRFTAATTADVPAIIKGAASQSADLQQWQDSAGTVLTKITSTGGIVSGGFSVNPVSGADLAFFVASTAAARPLIARGAASQSADLQQWQNSAGTVLANINNNGVAGFATGSLVGGQLIVVTNDARLSDARAPTGTAGGDLAGTYPSPTLAVAARRGAWGQYEAHSSQTDMNAVANWGGTFFNATAASSPTGAASQFYSEAHSLGSDYAIGTYVMQKATPRNVATPYEYVRFREGGTWGGWTKMSAGYADSAGGLVSGGFGSPAIVLGTAVAAGSATTALRSDATIVAFDTTVPAALVVGGASGVGAAGVAARRDHVHSLPAFGTTAGTFAQGNDSRLSDARTPTAHASTHLPGGTDALTTVAPTIALGTASAVGIATSFIRSDATIVAFDATAPAALGAAATGSITFAARRDHVHPTTGLFTTTTSNATTGTDTATAQVASGLTGATAASRYVGAVATVAPTTGTFAVGDYVVAQNGKFFVCTVAGTPGTWVEVGTGATYATPAIVLGTAAAAGVAASSIRSDATIVAFDATAPTTLAFGGAAAVGTIAFAARRDHAHGMPADPVPAHASAADPHTVYPLAAGTETISGAWTFSSGITVFGNSAGTRQFQIEGSTADALAPRIQSYASKPLYINELGNAVIVGSGGMTVGGQTVVVTNDARLSDARTPTGAAGGALAGTYPNPTLAAAAFGTPAIALGTAAAAGAAATALRSDATILAFDATVPTSDTFGTVAIAAAVGSATVAARRDHVHGFPALFDTTVPATIALATATSGVGVAAVAARRDHTHGVTGTLPVASGGTNATAVPTAGGIAYGTGSAYAFTAAGVARQVLTSNAAGAPTWVELDMTYLPGSAFKKSVRVASTANVAIATGTLLTIDGITTVAGDRVLLKDQTAPAENGIYVAAAGAWTRATDADSAAEIAAAIVVVDAGTANGGMTWTTTFKSTDTLGTTAMNWFLDLDASAFATPAVALGTAAAAGTGTGLLRANATIAAFDTTAPTTIAYGAAAAVGSVAFAARRDHTHGTPATPVTSAVAGTGITVSAATGAVTITNSAPQTFATPAIVLGTAAGAGVATTALRSDATIVAFDATAPTTLAFGGAAAVGTAAFAARRDHTHGMPADAVTSVNARTGAVTGLAEDNAVVKLTGSQTVTGLKTFQPAATTAIGVVVQALASQSGNLQEWQNSAGSILTRISSGGAFVTNLDITTNAYLYTNSGLRVGEVYGDAGLYRGTGNMKFSAASITFNHSDGTLRGTVDANGLSINQNLYLSGGFSMGGNWVIDTNGGWHRSYGNTGWYSNTHGGGIYMIDGTWVRTYGSKQFYCDRVIRADGGASNSGHSDNRGFRAESAYSSGNSFAGMQFHVPAYAWAQLYVESAYDGSLTAANGTASYFADIRCGIVYEGSSVEHKNAVEPLGRATALAKVRGLKPVRFRRNVTDADVLPENRGKRHTEHNLKGERMGFLAEDMMQAYPEVVQVDPDMKPVAINYSGLIAPLMAAVQELADKVAALEAARPAPPNLR